MKSFFRFLSQSLVKTKDVLQIYPLMITMAIIAAAAIIANNSLPSYSSSENNEFYIRIALIALLGISLSYAFNIWTQRNSKGLIGQAIACVLVVAMYFLLPEDIESPYFIYAFIVLGIVSHLLVSFIGFIGVEDEVRFWEYNKKLFINAVLTLIFTGVLVGGVELALVGVDKLFDVGLRDTYFNTFTLLSIVGSVIIFLLFSIEGIDEMEENDPYPQVLKFFVQYVLIPLMLIYAVILYAYMVKVIMQWELPRGWVTMLVSAYSVMGILAYLLVYPLRDRSEQAWVRVFADIFFYSLLPLVAFMGVAITKRVMDYGITEPRYFAVLLTIWLFCIGLYFVFRKEGRIKVIPISLFAIGLFALVIPFFNVFKVSLESQTHRFERRVEQLDLLDANDQLKIGERMTSRDLNDLNSMLNYLKKRGKLDDISHFFPESIRDRLDVDQYRMNLEDILNARSYVDRKDNFNWGNWEHRENADFISIRDFEWYKQNVFQRAEKKYMIDDKYGIQFLGDSVQDKKYYSIVFYENNDRVEVKLKPYLDAIEADLRNSNFDKRFYIEKVITHEDWKVKLMVSECRNHNGLFYIQADAMVSTPE